MAPGSNKTFFCLHNVIVVYSKQVHMHKHEMYKKMYRWHTNQTKPFGYFFSLLLCIYCCTQARDHLIFNYFFFALFVIYFLSTLNGINNVMLKDYYFKTGREIYALYLFSKIYCLGQISP